MDNPIESIYDMETDPKAKFEIYLLIDFRYNEYVVELDSWLCETLVLGPKNMYRTVVSFGHFLRQQPYFSRLVQVDTEFEDSVLLETYYGGKIYESTNSTSTKYASSKYNSTRTYNKFENKVEVFTNLKASSTMFNEKFISESINPVSHPEFINEYYFEQRVKRGI